MFTKILAPIDLAETQMTLHAVGYVEALANACDLDIRLISVQSLVPVAMLDYVPLDFDRNIRLGLERELTLIAAGINRPVDRVTTNLLFGPVYQTILGEAEACGSDLIVLSSHRPIRSRFFIGSNAEAIVKHANCSVLVLR